MQCTRVQKQHSHPTLTQMNGGVFYTDSTVETLIDTRLPTPPPLQNLLVDSLRWCNDLVQRDMRYAHLVAGASKMPMGMIWAARNQDELVNDSDLAKLKSLAWNEFIQKRYIPALSSSSGQSFAGAASSMLEIVQEMNLQRRRFQIMGLHEQVEASEIQLVLHLCQAGILRPTASTHGEYRSLANRFRRHDRFYEAFALAVGAFVCSSAPFTLGAATTRYERDLQFEYKKHTTALFVYVLKQHLGALDEAGVYDEDYVLRISRLIVVWPSGGGGGGGGFSGGDDGGDGDDRGGHRTSSRDRPPLQSIPDVQPSQGKESGNGLLDAVVAAQTMAERADHMANKAMRAVTKEVAACRDVTRTDIDRVREIMNREVAERNRIEHNLKEHCSTLVIGWLTSTWKKNGDAREKNLLFEGMFKDLKDYTLEEVRARTAEQAVSISSTFKTQVDASIAEMKGTVDANTRAMQDTLQASIGGIVGVALGASNARVQQMGTAIDTCNADLARVGSELVRVNGEQRTNTADIITGRARVEAALARILTVEQWSTICGTKVTKIESETTENTIKLREHDTAIGDMNETLTGLSERLNTQAADVAERDNLIDGLNDTLRVHGATLDNHDTILCRTFGLDPDENGRLIMCEDCPSLTGMHQTLMNMEREFSELVLNTNEDLKEMSRTIDEQTVNQHPGTEGDAPMSSKRQRSNTGHTDTKLDETTMNHIAELVVQRVLAHMQPTQPPQSHPPAAAGNTAAASSSTDNIGQTHAGPAPSADDLRIRQAALDARISALERIIQEAISGGTRPAYDDQQPVLPSASFAATTPPP